MFHTAKFIPQAPVRQFVVLWHDLPRDSSRPSHWDLMVEQEFGGLATWAADEFPLAPHEKPVRVRRLDDHRVEYLTYQGAVSGHRGTVSRCAWGQATWLRDSVDEACFKLQGISCLTPGQSIELTLTVAIEVRRWSRTSWLSAVGCR